MVLNEKYKDTNPITFYLSRILRLYPTYMIGAILIICISYEEISKLLATLSGIQQIIYVFTNTFLIGLDISRYLVDPPAWSLASELSFYLVAPFILKSQRKTLLFFLYGCLYLYVISKLTYPLSPSLEFFASAKINTFNYYFYPSSIFCFSLGAFAYNASKHGNPYQYFITAPIAIGLVAFDFVPQLLFAASLPLLFHYTKYNKFDRFIGELSYPAYILHWAFWMMIKPYTESNPKYFSIISFGTWVALASCFLGLFIYFALEKWVNKYRESNDFINSKSSNNRHLIFYKWILLSVYFLFPLVVLAYISQYQLT